MVDEIPNGSHLAVLSVATNDPGVAEFVVDELEFLLVGSKKFIVMDRRNLDAIRAEQNFQISGDVSDNSAVSIGQMLGVTIVITGSVTGTGSTRRLRVRAIEVETVRILSIASEAY
jgi:TolB-like protein